MSCKLYFGTRTPIDHRGRAGVARRTDAAFDAHADLAADDFLRHVEGQFESAFRPVTRVFGRRIERPVDHSSPSPRRCQTCGWEGATCGIGDAHCPRSN